MKPIPMVTFGLFFAIKVSAPRYLLAEIEDDEVGETPQHGEDLIEGGSEVSPANSIPWHVYIAPMGREKACGGTLISYQHVLTAAHCTQIWFDNRFQREFDVRVGVHNINSNSARYRVCNFVDHPQFNNKEHLKEGFIDYDFSILILKTRVKFGPKVRPAYLPPAHFGNDFLAGKMLTVSGWGREYAGQEQMTDVLKSVKVPGIRQAKCFTNYVRERIKSNNLCAGRPSGGTDACQGDSGGPLTYTEGGKTYVVGVVSWGTGCGEPNKAGIYGRVTKVMTWINEQLRKKC